MPGAPTLFLFVTLVGAAFTWNAYFPRRPQTWMAVPSFFAGWLTGELATHHFAWQVAATVIFVAAGALSAWPGWLGLGITVGSWIALLALVRVANRSAPVIDGALIEALGDELPEVPVEANPTPLGRLMIPFRMRHAEVRVTRNVRYAPGAGRRHLLDVYAPAAPTRNAPVLFQIHGGAWTIGEKREQALPLMNHMGSRGWVCVAANYRLSPKATFPDHLVDLKLALRWIRETIAEYGGDPSFVVATGGSAGGHLSSLLTLSANDPEYQPGFEDLDTTLQGCVPFYGIFDFANEFHHDHFEGMERFLGRVVMKKRFAEDPRAYEKASPVARVHPDAPPFFVVHGTHDSLAPVCEARDFVGKLRTVSKAPVAYAEIPGAQHAFELFPSLRSDLTRQGIERFLAATWSEHREARDSGP